MNTYYRTDLGGALEHLNWLANQHAKFLSTGQSIALYRDMQRVTDAYLAEQTDADLPWENMPLIYS